MNEFIELAKGFGFPVALAAFFVWWTYQRDMKQGQKLDEVNSYIRDKLEGLVTGATTMLGRVADVISKCDRK